jgi:hypothetical protein
LGEKGTEEHHFKMEIRITPNALINRRQDLTNVI